MRRAVVPILIGLVGFTVATLLFVYRNQMISSAQVAVSDFFTVRANGLRLGSRPASQDIVIIHYDNPTATELGFVHSYEKDLELYRKLFAAGPKALFDARMVAAGDEAAYKDLEPLLLGMRDIDRSGRVLRDVWLPSTLKTEHDDDFHTMLPHNILNWHPHEIPSAASRLYPIATFSRTGVKETAPLALCRKYWNLPTPSSIDVGEELRRSGVMSMWHKQSPALVPESSVPKSPYALADSNVYWHSFLSASPFVPPAAFWVSYDIPVSDYPKISYLDAYKSKDLSMIRDKIVIIGYSPDIDPTSDTYSIPSLLNRASAAELVACATQTLIDRKTMRETPLPVHLAVAFVFIVGLAVFAGMAKPIQAVLGSALCLLAFFALAVLAYRSGWYFDFLIVPALALCTAIPAAATNAWLTARARQQVIDLFGRYVPRAIVNQMIQRSELERLTLGGSEREVTVMFADIRGFTKFSENLSPGLVVQELNSILKVMVDCTFENDGTLDKFIGDAILVLFNTPLDQPDHSLRAVRTAVGIQQKIRNHASGLQVGIGIHRGLAVVGNIGTPERMEYTAIGSTVNIASRLCDLAKAGEIVLSENVSQSVAGEFRVHSLGDVTVKGVSQPIAASNVTIPT